MYHAEPLRYAELNQDKILKIYMVNHKFFDFLSVLCVSA